MASQVDNGGGLEWLERLMRISAPPAFGLSPSRFHCRLASQPDHLVPASFVDAESKTDSVGCKSQINADVVFTHDAELPAPIASDAQSLENFALRGPIAWTRDPGSRALQPFWLESAWGEALTGTGARNPCPLSPEVRRILAMANILVSGDALSKRRERWIQTTSHLSREFVNKGYAPISGLIHPFHIAALRRYYRYLIRAGRFQQGDEQSSRRYVAHNEAVARFFHHQLTNSIGAIAGEPVKPSYVYIASYQGGAKLEKHTDRKQCEFSVTLCLDYSPEPQRETGWPIQLHTPTGRVTVFQAIGDGLVYRGRELPHSRDPLPPQETSTSIFFHYVRESFSGSLD